MSLKICLSLYNSKSRPFLKYNTSLIKLIGHCVLGIGASKDLRWQSGGRRTQEVNNIAIHVTPPDGEEDDEIVPPLRARRKLSSPLSGLPNAESSLVGPAPRSLSPLDRTRRRFSTMVSSAAAAAVSRRLSATIGWCLASPTQVKPQIVRQGRALCLQYIKTQIRRSSICPNKQIVMKRLQQMLETECGEEAAVNLESGVLAALRALCAALERKQPDAFRHIARQATRAPATMLRSDVALAELALALARRVTRENITWSKIAAVYCICGALAREAAEASEGEPPIELVAAPAAAIADVLHEETGSWIAAHGGWNGLIERLRVSDRDQRSEKTLRVMVSFFITACLLLLLLRWANILLTSPRDYIVEDI
ncbi:Bcl-2-related ovarian killer protein [Papilio machaon]|uniref:Bcl-2-related ovarian killer protein n=1 Tax=Papilio machaon TaxID=76193 RepID=A0A194RCX2_PAPMA|nr:Bcl-2-related ovarian killer protein [Papilio machaon]